MAWKQVKDTQELLRVFMIMFKQFSYAYVCFQNIKWYLAILNTMFWNRFNNTFYFLFLMHHYFAKRSLYLKNFLWQFDFPIFCVAIIHITILYHFSSIDTANVYEVYEYSKYSLLNVNCIIITFVYVFCKRQILYFCFIL